jgi:hypothetical protein
MPVGGGLGDYAMLAWVSAILGSVLLLCWFLPARPPALAFCAHAITRPDELLVVTDAAQDSRFPPIIRSSPRNRGYVFMLARRW